MTTDDKLPPPLTPEERIERGFRTIDDLCSGRLRWEMRVPAEPDHDPDLVLSDALQAALERIAERTATLDAERAGAGRLRAALVTAWEIIEANPGEDVCRHGWFVDECERDCIDRTRREEIKGALALDAEPGQPR